MSITVKVVGATGYGGVGVIELLLGHPEVDLAALVATADVGKPISSIYPHLDGHCDLPVLAAGDADAQGAFDLVFFATPDRVGMEMAPVELSKGARVIDYSGDFRFNSAEAYAEYARRLSKDPSHLCADLLPESVYGLTELHRAEITSETRLVGNPGCFAVSCILGLAPAVQAGAVDANGLICDCKTGVSGAGKKPSAGFHFPARYENMNAYRLSGHQHVCEVERELGLLRGEDVAITFTAQVVPQCRGIMSTLYGRAAEGMTRENLLQIYQDHYANDRFVRVYDRDAVVGSADVRGTNYCNLVVDLDARTGVVRIVSHIDNLMKGQAGSALQNMNAMFGLDERVGLDRPGQYP